MTSTTPLDVLLEAMTDRLSRITDTVIDRLYGNIQSYSVVPRDQLEASIEEIVHLVTDVLRTGVVPAPGDIRQARISSLRRSRQNVPIQDIMRAFRYTIGGIHEVLLALADTAVMPPTDLVQVTDILWRFSDSYTASQVAAFQSAEVDRVLSRVRRSQQFLQQLFEGASDDFSIRRSALELGLRVGSKHAAVLSRSADSEAADRLRLRLELNARSAHHSALFTVVGTTLMGVTEGDVPPAATSSSDVVAVGEHGDLSQMPASFRDATRALDAAEILGTGGVVSTRMLSWRMAALHATDVNELLDARYLAPLRAQGVFGELIEETVRAYLAADRSIPKAARSIPLHVNTLRYRLRRFEDVTGQSLESTATIVELSWALEVTVPAIRARVD